MTGGGRSIGHVSPEDYYNRRIDRATAEAHLAGCEACREGIDAAAAHLRELTCRDVVELVTDYLEDAVDIGLRTRIDEHLRLCEGCRRYLDEMRATIATLGRIPRDTEVPEELGAALLEAFRTSRGRTRGSGGR
jgi:predicted anti-sigma-YlaC factor YlaD